MFIYIVIDNTNYPLGSFVKIEDARIFRDNNTNCRIVKSNLIGETPNDTKINNLREQVGLAQKNLNVPDELKTLFGMKIN